MNKIDVLLNSIAQKHLSIETVGVRGQPGKDAPPLTVPNLHAALLAAFQGGVRHGAAEVKGLLSTPLIREVDIDLAKLEHACAPVS
jgi:hypothetical protein